jgi:aspartyl/glutamyl-tRNA(Asn/Gln) amidotransferase C subunit
MGAVDPQTVRHIAQLAQLDLPEERLQQTADELSEILAHMATISEFAVSQEARDSGAKPRRRSDEPVQGPNTHLVQAPTVGTEVAVPQVKDAS